MKSYLTAQWSFEKSHIQRIYYFVRFRICFIGSSLYIDHLRNLNSSSHQLFQFWRPLSRSVAFSRFAALEKNQGTSDISLFGEEEEAKTKQLKRNNNKEEEPEEEERQTGRGKK